MENNFSGKGKIRLTDVLGVNAEDYNAEGSELLVPGSYFIPGAEGFFYAGGRRKECKAKGLKGKAFRKCTKELRERDRKDKDKQKTNKRIAARILTGGLSGIFESKEQRKKTTGQMVKDTKRVGGDVWKGIKHSIFGVPLLAYIGAVRINAFSQAYHLYPGTLTLEKAREAGFDVKNWEKSKKLVDKVEKMLKDLGAATEKDIKTFRGAVSGGFKRPPFKSKKKKAENKAKQQAGIDKYKKEQEAQKKAAEQKKQALASAPKPKSFDADDDEWSNAEGWSAAGIITAASALIGTVASFIAKSGTKSNPYADGKTPPDFVPDEDDTKPELASKADQTQAIREQIANDPNIPEDQKQEMLANVGAAVNELNDEASGMTDDDTLTYVVVGAAGLAAIGLLVWIFKPKA